MEKSSSVSEAAAIYGTAVADLRQPLILQQANQPWVVIVPFEEYQHLRALADDEVQRRQAGWQKLVELMTEMQQRPTPYTPQEIEAEITRARREVRKERHADHRRA